jgi:hypothetical protein
LAYSITINYFLPLFHLGVFMLDEQQAESCQPQYLDLSKCITKLRPLFRTTGPGGRYYFDVDPKGNVKRYPSVTTILNHVFPKSEYLIKWIAEHGIKQAEFLKMKAAHYGTLMHICLSQYLMDGYFSFDSLPGRIQTYIWDNRIDFDTSLWLHELKKDIFAFDKFCFDYQVKPIAIAVMLASLSLNVAGELDIVVELTIGTGVNGLAKKNDLTYDSYGNVRSDKRMKINAIVDFKSGRHGFFPQHEAQLKMYERMWNENFPTVPVTHVFNWSPDNWETTPAYKFKNQSASREGVKIDDYVKFFNIDKDSEKTFSYTKFTGALKLGENNAKSLVINSFDDRARKFSGWNSPGVVQEVNQFDTSNLPVVYSDDIKKILKQEKEKLNDSTSIVEQFKSLIQNT